MQTMQPAVIQRGTCSTITASDSAVSAPLFRAQLAAAGDSVVPLVTRRNPVSFVSAAPTLRGTFSHIYAAGGVRALYAGLFPTLMRAAPANAAVFYVYEQAIQVMAEWH